MFWKIAHNDQKRVVKLNQMRVKLHAKMSALKNVLEKGVK